MCLVAVRGAIALRAVGDEHEVVVGQVDALGLAALRVFDAAGRFAAARHLAHHVGHIRVIQHLRPGVRDVLDHRADHGIILVVAGETQCGQIGQSVDVMDVTLHIALHLDGAVPFLEREHRLPVHPEVCLVEIVVEHVIDGLVGELFVRGHEQVQQLLRRLRVHPVLLVGVRVLTLLLGDATQGEVRVVLVELVVFGENRLSGVLDGRDGTEQVPHDLEMVVHLTAAAHDVAACRIVDAVAGAAGHRQGFEDRDMVAGHLGVADQVACRRQAGKTGPDDIRVLVVDALRFLRGREGFIVSSRVVHDDSFAVFSSTGLTAGLEPLRNRASTSRRAPL